MLPIKACGIIIFRQQKNKHEFLLIQQHAGHWGFPKGHQEVGEDDITTALRETKEETGLDEINILENFQTNEQYLVNNKPKEVTYFLGKTNQQNITIQPEEISQYAWLTEQETIQKLTFQNSKKTFIKAINFINTTKKL